VGAMATALGGLDALVFTAGIGENSALVRAAVCERLGFVGLQLDLDANESARPDTMVSTADSPVRVLVLQAPQDVVAARAARPPPPRADVPSRCRRRRCRPDRAWAGTRRPRPRRGGSTRRPRPRTVAGLPRIRPRRRRPPTASGRRVAARAPPPRGAIRTRTPP